MLNAVVTPVFDRAAEAGARLRSRADPAGPFAGVPYLVKDLACEMEGVRFTEGSRFLAGNVSAFDSELVLRLRRAGLVILGKTNTPEFGMAPACEPVLFGPTRNPWDTQRSTSGSSGGSAAAVASGMVPFAHGNDLGGSLRYPASACGLFALKPTRARNPLGPEYGDVAAGGAADHALTRSVRDSAALLDATSGPDLGDPYWAPPPARPFLAEVGADPGRLRIGYTTRTPDGDPGHPGLRRGRRSRRPAVRLARPRGYRDRLAGLYSRGRRGHRHDDLRRRGVDHALLDPPRRPRARRRRDRAAEPGAVAGRREGHRGRVAARRGGRPALQPPGRPLLHRLRRIPHANDVDAAAAHRHDGLDAGGSVAGTPGQRQTVRYAGVVANLTGNPAMSVPLWWNDDGLPIGVHFLGRFGDEATLIRLASQLEAAQPWAGRLPAVHAANLAGSKAGAAEPRS